jgi:ribonuclease J
MMSDLDEANCLDGASFIYSQCACYLEQGVYASMEVWLKSRGIKMRHVHTSGHASPNDLKRFAKALAPRALVPIHSFAPERFGEMFDSVMPRRDGEWWEV